MCYFTLTLCSCQHHNERKIECDKAKNYNENQASTPCTVIYDSPPEAQKPTMMKCNQCHQDWINGWHGWWEQNWAPYREMLRYDPVLTPEMTSMKQGYDDRLLHNRQLWVNNDIGRDNYMYGQYEGAIVDYWEEAKALLDAACIKAGYMEDPNQPLNLSYDGGNSGSGGSGSSSQHYGGGGGPGAHHSGAGSSSTGSHSRSGTSYGHKSSRHGQSSKSHGKGSSSSYGHGHGSGSHGKSGSSHGKHK